MPRLLPRSSFWMCPLVNTTQSTRPSTCIVGLQWGDEGKGKIVDYLAGGFDYVVRYCGGANAGHSVHIEGHPEKFALHLLPCGLLREGVVSVVGNGVVADCSVLLAEMDALIARGVSVDPTRLRISEKAHLVMPWHRLEDASRESQPGAIGTTRRGIGPAYADKAHRSTAFRMADLLFPAELADRIRHVHGLKVRQFGELAAGQLVPVEELVEQSAGFAARIGPFITDTSTELLDAMDAGRSLLFEGAHGFLLDIDHGTFPYVTSSSCSPLGACSGAGVPPRAIREYLGVLKSYCTRVGAGPFPTEQDNAVGAAIRERGREYGTTTGRPRRCGWFDAVAARYAVRVGGITQVALTLLDVLSGLEQVQIATGYRLGGEAIRSFPCDPRRLGAVEPEYETMAGWSEPIGEARRFEDLPAACRAYVDRLEALIGVPVSLISVSPQRSATIVREPARALV